MRRQFLIGAVVVVAISLSFAAAAGHFRHGHGPERTAHHAEHVIEQLNLQGAQAEQVREVFTAAGDSATALHERMRAEMCAIHQAAKQQLTEVLNADQMAELDALREAHQARRAQHLAEHGMAGGHGPRMDFTDCELE